jgi:hypothetical protein
VLIVLIALVLLVLLVLLVVLARRLAMTPSAAADPARTAA